MAQDSIVCTIASTQFPFHLQMDGNGVVHTETGSGNLGVGHGAGPLDQFRLSPPPKDKPEWVTPLESVAYPNVFVRMDGDGVNAQKPVGGSVTKQLDKAAYEFFIIHQLTPDTVAIESQAFRGVFLRLSTEGAGDAGVVINCQFGIGPAAKFRLGTPPAKTQLRVLSYNTHLMQLSFIEEATDFGRKWQPTPYAVWQDGARRSVIIRNAISSLADIVSFQEVWATQYEDYFRSSLKHLYPYSLVGDRKEGPFDAEATSGLVLCSKFELTDRFFGPFPGMGGWDSYSNKGVLCGVANIPNAGRLRVGTGHTTGELRDVQWIADKTVTEFSAGKDLPAIMMGDFNIGWKSGEGNEGYQEMKKVFSFPSKDIMPASDSWNHVHGEGINPNPYTVKMCDNKLHQLFSPERDTEPDIRLDYLWVKPGVTQSWSPVKASVPRGPDWTYTSPHWHWAHKNNAVQLPAAASLNNLLVVVSKESGEEVEDNGRIMCAILDKNTLKWRHVFAGIFTSASPGIVAFDGKFHLFYRYHEGNAIFHSSSENGETWSPGEYIGFDTGGGVCPIKYGKDLYLFSVDDDGIGGMIFCTIKTGAGFGPGNWGARTPIGITTLEGISATEFNNWLVVVSKDNDDTSGRYASSGIMCAIFKPETNRWEWSQPKDLVTKAPPGVIAVGNRLHVYYLDAELGGNGIYRAIFDGEKWEINQNTGQEMARGGVCPALFNDRLWLFYPYFNVEPGHGYYSEFCMLHTQMPSVEIDLSDHYPLLVDFDIAYVQVVVTMKDKGDGIFADGEWAGTRAETRQLEGFKLTSQIPNLKLKYMAHIQDHGDTDWKNDGDPVGISGKRIEGFRIRLEGDAAPLYELTYRAHLHGTGDTDPVTEGHYCGTTDEKRAVEAMWIELKRK